MTEKKVITLSEFKTVVEQFEQSQKRIVEVMEYNFKQVKEQIGFLLEGQTELKSDVRELKSDVAVLKGDMAGVKSELKTLADGQDAIRADLRKKVDYEDFVKLETRVARLENRAA